MNEVLLNRDAMQLAMQTARGLGASQVDVIWQESDELSVELLHGRTSRVERSRSLGLGVRVFCDGRPGTSWTERPTRQAIVAAVEEARALSRLVDPIDIELPDSRPEIRDLGLTDPALATWSADACVEVARHAGESALDVCGTSHIPHLGATRSRGLFAVANHRGLMLEEEAASGSLWVGAVARDANGTTKMGWDSLTVRDPALLDPAGIGQRAGHRAVELLGARPIDSGPLPVLFDWRIASSLLSVFLGAFHADAVLKGTSRLSGRLGERVAPEGFRLASDPWMTSMAGSRTFDGEGVTCKPNGLVSDGVLCGFLHTLETSRLMGIDPTGDATRSYASERPSSAFSNLVVECGGKPDDELLGMFPRLLHVVRLEGSSGCNGVSGDISVGVQGFLVENGRRVHPVDRVTVSGNFFDLLRNLVGCGRIVRPGVHGMFVPSLLTSRLDVAS